MLKISQISRVRGTSEIGDVFTTRDEIFLYLPKKKVKFLLNLFFIKGKKLSFFPSRFSFIFPAQLI